MRQNNATKHKGSEQQASKRKNISVPPALHERLTDIASRNHRSLVGQLEYLIERDESRQEALAG